MSHLSSRSMVTICSAAAFVLTGLIGTSLTSESKRVKEEDHVAAVEPTIEPVPEAVAAVESTIEPVPEAVAPSEMTQEAEKSIAADSNNDSLQSILAADDDSIHDIIFLTTEQENAQMDNMNAETEVKVSSDSSLIVNLDAEEEYVVYDGDVDSIVLSSHKKTQFKYPDMLETIEKDSKTIKRFRSKKRSGKRQKGKTKLGRLKRRIKSRFVRKPKKFRLGMSQAQTKVGRLKDKVSDFVFNQEPLDYWKVKNSRSMNSFLPEQESVDMDLDIVDQWNMGKEGLSKTNKDLFKGQTLEKLLAKSDFFREAWLNRVVRARTESDSTSPMSSQTMESSSRVLEIY